MLSKSEFPLLRKSINKRFDELNQKADYIEKSININTLYRVGIPRITETTNRFNCGRDTGGIGTGIYAYYTRKAAIKDSNYEKGKQPIYRLSNIIHNPLELESEKESYALNDLGKNMRCHDMLAIRTQIAFNDIPSLKRQMYKIMSTISDKETIDENYEEWILEYINMAIEFSDECPLKYNKPKIIDDKDYTSIIGSKHCSQPMNYLLYKLLEIDSVIPYGYLADSNGMGCVILKETVDKYLGRKTIGGEDITDIGIVMNIKEIEHLNELINKDLI